MWWIEESSRSSTVQQGTEHPEHIEHESALMNGRKACTPPLVVGGDGVEHALSPDPKVPFHQRAYRGKEKTCVPVVISALAQH